MSSFSNQSKQAAATFANQSANQASMKAHVKPGQGYPYDLDYMAYDEVTDPISGNAIYYDSIGTAPSWSNQAKS